MDMYECMWKELEEEIKNKERWRYDDLRMLMVDIKERALNAMLDDMAKRLEVA